MSDYEAFVHELIGYIFKVQDKDDDNLSAEIICRKLYKYGLIENVNHEWRMKYRPKHRWPATVHNGRADKEDWQSYTIDRKTEPTISKMEQVDKDINVRSKDCTTCRHAGENYEDPCELCYRHSHYEPKDEPQTYVINPQEPTNDDKCFECDDFFTCGGQCNKIEDEPQTDCPKTCPSIDICTKDDTDCPWK